MAPPPGICGQIKRQQALYPWTGQKTTDIVSVDRSKDNRHGIQNAPPPGLSGQVKNNRHCIQMTLCLWSDHKTTDIMHSNAPPSGIRSKDNRHYICGYMKRQQTLYLWSYQKTTDIVSVVRSEDNRHCIPNTPPPGICGWTTNRQQTVHTEWQQQKEQKTQNNLPRM